MRLLAVIFLVFICAVEAAQIQLSWLPVSTNTLTILYCTNVIYSAATLTATTNKIISQWGADSGTKLIARITQPGGWYGATIQSMTLITADMLIGWKPHTIVPAGMAGIVVPVDGTDKMFFHIEDSGTGSVNLGWDAANPVSNVTGYRLYRGGAAGNYTNTMLLGKVTTVTVTGLVKGSTNYFVLTAIAARGESGYSQELKVPVARQDYQVFIKRI